MRGDKLVIRKEPYTYKHPSEAQIKARILYGQLMKKFRGDIKKVAEILKGMNFGRKEKKTVLQQELEEAVRLREKLVKRIGRHILEYKLKKSLL